MRRPVVIGLAGAGVAVVAVAAAAYPTLDAFQPVAASASFGVFDRPQGDADRAARDSYAGDDTISLADARLLGTVAQTGVKVMLAPHGDQLCLVVIKAPESSAGVCERVDALPERGLWTKYGGDGGAYLVVAIPDELSDAEVRASGRVLVREPNLVVTTAADRGESDTLVLQSDRFRDLAVETRD